MDAAAQGEAHCGNARVERKHLCANFFKLGNVPLPLAYQRHQAVVD